MATPILSLQEISEGVASQASLHNQALRQIEARTVRVLSKSTTAPPGSPAESDSYIIPTGSPVSWAGTANQIAIFVGGAWSYYSPVEGVSVWVNDLNATYAYDGAAWVTASAGGTVTSVAVTDPAAGITVSGDPITTSGTLVIALANDLAAVEGLATTGIVRRTAADTWSAGTAVSLTAEVTGVLPVANYATGTPSGAKFVRDDGVLAVPAGTGGDAVTTNPLSQFAATTSAQLAGVISDETGSGALVFATSPTLVTPALGTPSAAVLTNATGLPVAGGGTGVATLTAYAPVFGGTTSTGAVQSGTAGTSGHVLTSNGAGVLPTFQAAGGGSTRLDQITTGTADSTLTTSGFVTVNSGAGAANTVGKTITIQPGAGGATNAAGGPLNATGGTGAGTGAGGAVTITGGTAGSTGVGGAVAIQGGTPISGTGGAVSISAAAGTGSNNGGAVTIASGAAGTGQTGGAFTLTSGAGAGGNPGGAITITAGQSGASAVTHSDITISGGAGGGNAGYATLQGGTGNVNGGGLGGNVSVKGGAGAAQSSGGSGIAGGSATLISGAGGSGGSGGWNGGAAGAVAVTGGVGGAATSGGTGGAGGSIGLTGGAGGAFGNVNGGDITLSGGAAVGTGKPGNVVLNGTGSALTTTATGGFTCIPTCAGTPTGVPASIPTGTVPMVFDTTGVKLWIYTGGAWKGVVVA